MRLLIAAVCFAASGVQGATASSIENPPAGAGNATDVQRRGETGETCVGCAAGLMCAAGHSKDAPQCSFPLDPVAAFGEDATDLTFTNANLVDELFPTNLCAVFPQLQVLDLDNNPGVKAGPVPAWLSECKQLQKLDLYNTKRTGDLAAAVANLGVLNETLTFTNLGANAFDAGPVPVAELAPFAKLTYLSLAGTNRNGDLAEALDGLATALNSTLTTIYLDGNPFDAGPVPVAELAPFAKLTYLHLGGTNRNGNLAGALDGLAAALNSTLNNLYLSSNPLFDAGPVPVQALAPFTRLTYLSLYNTNRNGDLGAAVAGLAKHFSATLTFLQLGSNPSFDAGPVPNGAAFSKMSYLYLGGTNRHGPLGSVRFPASLTRLHLHDNPALDAGPVPKSLSTLPKLGELRLTNANRYGPVDVDACGLAAARGEACVCTSAYAGPRCETCVGCAAGLMCAAGHREDAPQCSLPPDPAAAFGEDATDVTFSSANLVDELFPTNLCAVFPQLQVLDLGSNPGVKAGPVPAWLSECKQLQRLRLYNIKRTGDLAAAVATLGVLNTTLTSMSLGANAFDAGPMPVDALAPFAKLTYLNLAGTNRNGNLAEALDGLAAALNSTSPTLYLSSNPLFDAGPVPVQALAPFTRLASLNLYNTNRNGDLVAAVAGLVKHFSATLTYLQLGSNPSFDAGPVPNVAAFSKMFHLYLDNTNRHGPLGSARFPASLTRLELHDNPALDAGPVPKSLSTLAKLGTLRLTNANRYGPVDVDACGLAAARGEACVCTPAYAGPRCETCVGCAAGLMCAAGHREDAPQCSFPLDPAAAFGEDATILRFANADLVGGLGPNMAAELPLLEVLDLSDNPGLLPGPLWSWLKGLRYLRELQLRNSSRDGPLGSAHLPPTLRILNLGGNPAFTTGPIPASFASLNAAETVSIDTANRVGFVGGSTDASTCATAFAQGHSCSDLNLCSKEYTGRRCETCIGCKQSLMCSESVEGACQIPADAAAAFGLTAEALLLSDARLTGRVPQMLTLTVLERLDVSHNPNLAPTQDWSWIESLPNLTDVNLYNSNQQAPYGHVCSGGGSQACLAGSTCRTHCCKPDVADSCKFCTDDGSCYAPLELSTAGWNASEMLTAGWLPRYNKDEKLEIPGPSKDVQELLQLLTRNSAPVADDDAARIMFTLAWGDGEGNNAGGGAGIDSGGGGGGAGGNRNTWTAEQYKGRPPLNLFPSDAGMDPGVFDADSTTGAIVGVPQRNGKYTVWLLLEHRHDGGSGTGGRSTGAASHGLPKELDQVVLKRWSFEVTGKPDFAILRYNRPPFEGADANGGTVGQTATKHRVECVVGETTRIGPLDVSRYHTGEDLEHFAGNPAKITFTLTDEPGGFFISPQTGEIQAVPDAAGEHYVALWASDESGALSFVETMHVVITEPKQFATQPQAWDVTNNTVAASFKPTYTSGIAYSFAGPPLSKRELFADAAEDDYAAIIYKLEFADGKSPGKMFVDTGSGEMLMNPTEVGNFTVTLSAVDRKGAPVTVATVSFEVKVVQAFKLSSRWNPDDMVAGIQPLYQTDAFHDIQAPRLSKNELFEGVESGDPTKVVYALELVDSVSGLDQDGVDLGKFFVAQSGEMYIKPTVPGSYNATLVARDTSGQSVVVKAFAFEARPDDVLDPSNGPNGNGCGEHGTEVDRVPLNYMFECECTEITYSGANCETYQPLATITEAAQDTGPIIGGALGGLIVIMFVVVMVFRRRAHLQKMRAVDFASALRSLIEDGEINEDQVHDQNMPREIRRSAVTMSDKIGSGAFGDVFKAVLDESTTIPGYMVAVKTSNVVFGEGADELVKEATMMAQVGRHDNLVSLVGVVTAGPPLLLLLTYCEHGSLLSYLKKAAKNAAVVPIHTKYKMAADVARGMEHLSAAGFIHRDLAARNVLVASNFSCKVADFGLSRASAKSASAPAVEDENGEDASDGGDYYRSKNGVFPIKWTAPEAMEALKFTRASDAWSFGIVLVEMMQDGAGPYAKWNTNLVMMKVIGGFKHAQPPGCPDVLYDVILACLATEPSARPSFGTLVERLQELHDPNGDLGAAAAAAAGAMGGIAETNIDAEYLAPVAIAEVEPSAQYLTVNAGNLQSNVGASEGGEERCSRCNAKRKFCACNVRRSTADMSFSQRPKKPNGKARAAHAGAQQQHRTPHLRARSGANGNNHDTPTVSQTESNTQFTVSAPLGGATQYTAGLSAVAPPTAAATSQYTAFSDAFGSISAVAGQPHAALPNPAATSQYMTGLPAYTATNAAGESRGGRARPQAVSTGTPATAGGNDGGTKQKKAERSRRQQKVASERVRTLTGDNADDGGSDL